MTTEYTEFKEIPNETQPETDRDPVLDLEVSLKLKVEDVNALLALLAKLPFAEVANVIMAIRNDVIKQVNEQTAENKAAE